jgi:hypothetical protein
MKSIRGSVRQEGGQMLRDLDVRVTEGPDGEGGTQWFGSFELPPGSEIAEGGRYLLQLEDGRAGDIVVQNAEPADGRGGNGVPVSVGFTGVGSLRER